MRRSSQSPFLMRLLHDSAFVLRSAYCRLRYRPPRPTHTPPPTPSPDPLPEPIPLTLADLLQDVRRPVLRLPDWRLPALRLPAVRPALRRLWQGETRLRDAGWLVMVVAPILLAVAVPVTLEGAVGLWRSAERHWRVFTSGAGIAPFFAPSVQYWRDDILHWAQQHDLDPNLLATVMQIESCGHPTVMSSAGAQGLFQVMPFHFEHGEDPLDPATNAYRGATFLAYCLRSAGNDPGLAMACYNGGPSVLGRSFGNWARETQRYYLWGVGIYNEARDMPHESVALNSWYQAGGARLCRMADDALR